MEFKSRWSVGDPQKLDISKSGSVRFRTVVTMLSTGHHEQRRVQMRLL